MGRAADFSQSFFWGCAERGLLGCWAVVAERLLAGFLEVAVEPLLRSGAGRSSAWLYSNRARVSFGSRFEGRLEQDPCMVRLLAFALALTRMLRGLASFETSSSATAAICLPEQ